MKSNIYVGFSRLSLVAFEFRVTSGSRKLQKASTCFTQRSLIGTPETQVARPGGASAIEPHISPIGAGENFGPGF
jgi:hypothetical protein